MMKFNNLHEVAAAKAQLRLERDRMQLGLKDQLALIGERDFRKGLISDAIGDMLEAWRPIRAIRNAVIGSGGIARGALGLTLGAKAKTPIGRVLMTAISFALPAILKRFGKDPNMGLDTVEDELKTSWERIKTYVEERKAAHTNNEV